MFLQLAFKTLLQGECVSSGASKTSEYFVVIEAPDLAGSALDDDIAQVT